MVKIIVIAETITSSVIRWINVNQFDLSTELLFEGMERDEIVALDNEVFANRAVLVPLDVRYVLFTVSSVAFPVREHLWIEHPIDFVLCKGFVEEDFFALLLFLCLPTFKDTIFVGPNERDLAAFTEKFAFNIQTDLITESGVGVGEEVFVGDVIDEDVVVEDPMPVNLVKELCFYLIVSKE